MFTWNSLFLTFLVNLQTKKNWFLKLHCALAIGMFWKLTNAILMYVLGHALHTQFIYYDSMLLVLVVYFSDPIWTSSWAIWVEKHARHNLSRQARKTSANFHDFWPLPHYHRHSSNILMKGIFDPYVPLDHRHMGTPLPGLDISIENLYYSV